MFRCFGLHQHSRDTMTGANLPDRLKGSPVGNYKSSAKDFHRNWGFKHRSDEVRKVIEKRIHCLA